MLLFRHALNSGRLYSQHAFDTNSQSFVRLIGKCANKKTDALKDSFVMNNIKANEPVNISHLDIVNLILFTNKILINHRKHSHLASYEYFSHLKSKSVQTLNESKAAQRAIFNRAISIETIEKLISCIDLEQNEEIFECIVDILSIDDLLSGDFNSYAKIFYVLVPFTIKNKKKNYDFVWKNMLNQWKNTKCIDAVCTIWHCHKFFFLYFASKKNDILSPINCMQISVKILEFIEENIDFKELKGQQIKHLLVGLMQSNKFLTKLFAHFTATKNLKERDVEDLILLLDGMQFVQKYDDLSKKWNEYLNECDANKQMFKKAVKIICNQINDRIALKSAISVELLLRILANALFDDQRLIHSIDRILKQTMNENIICSLLWCHAVNNIPFENMMECIQMLLAIDAQNEHDFDSLIRGGYAVLILVANDLISQQCVQSNMDLLCQFFHFILTQFDNVKQTKFDRWIGSILRLNVGMKLMNFGMDSLPNGIVKHLEKRFVAETAANKGSKLEKTIINELHVECKRNDFWIDKIVKIKRNVMVESMECDIVIYLKQHSKRQNIVIDVLGSHHFLTFDDDAICGKTKFRQWMLKKMNYKIYQVDARNFNTINTAKIIKDVEKML